MRPVNRFLGILVIGGMRGTCISPPVVIRALAFESTALAISR